jgi:uncharacterized membrane protein YdjX (TVP38/TMEM64 family)
MTVHPDIRALAALSLRVFRRRTLLWLGLGAVAVAAIVAMGWQRQISLETLIRYRAMVETFVAAHRLAALAGYVACYAVAAGLALPGVVFLTMGAGVFFGGLVGGFAAVIGATIGAAVVFAVGKLALRDLAMRRIGPQMERFAKGFRESAFSYLLFLRLVPIFPFSLGNLLPAVCDVRFATFVAATAIGIAPMTFAIAFFGAGLDSALAPQLARYHACVSSGAADCRLDFALSMAVTPQLVGALAALGVAALLPVLVKRSRLARGEAGSR